jgi:glycine cleavage system H protein
MIVARVQDQDYPDHLFYDVDNQIWYEALADGKIRAGMTPIAVSLAGEVLVFTPKRLGRDFEKGRSFATVECGKWVGAARAAFAGVVEAHNEALVKKPELLNEDAFGKGWMLIVRSARDDWRAGLVTGAAIAPAFGEWITSEAFKDRTE